MELNFILILQGELNELFWSQFLGVSVTLHCHSQRRVKTLLRELFFWGCLNSAKGADVTPYLNSFVLEVTRITDPYTGECFNQSKNLSLF